MAPTQRATGANRSPARRSVPNGEADSQAVPAQTWAEGSPPEDEVAESPTVPAAPVESSQPGEPSPRFPEPLPPSKATRTPRTRTRRATPRTASASSVTEPVSQPELTAAEAFDAEPAAVEPPAAEPAVEDPVAAEAPAAAEAPEADAPEVETPEAPSSSIPPRDEAPARTQSEQPFDVAALVARASGRPAAASPAPAPEPNEPAPAASASAAASPAKTAPAGGKSPPTKQREASWRVKRRHLVLLAVALVLLGAILGALFAATTNKSTAFARVNGGPGTTQSEQLAVSGDQANRYVQTEVLFLSDPAVAQRVKEQLQLTATPSYAVRQVGNTSILEIVATADTGEVAADVANSVVADYVAGWRARSDDELVGRIETAQSQLTAVQSQMNDLGGDRVTPNEQAQLNAYSVQAQQLQGQLNDLTAQRAEVQSAIRIVTEASSDFAGRTSSPRMMALLGALLGGLVAVGVWVWVRRRQP